MANTNRNKGHIGERLYAKLFRELGFSFCKTTRQSSRMLDDAGIDLDFLPFNIQIKTGLHRGMNPSKVLNIIDERLPKLFPPNDPVHKKTNILIHRNQIGPGNKRDNLDDLVYMRFLDFIILTSQIKKEFFVITKRGMKRNWTEKTVLASVRITSTIIVLKHIKAKRIKSYRTLAIMSFQDFTKIIKEIKWE